MSNAIKEKLEKLEKTISKLRFAGETVYSLHCLSSSISLQQTEHSNMDFRFLHRRWQSFNLFKANGSPYNFIEKYCDIYCMRAKTKYLKTCSLGYILERFFSFSVKQRFSLCFLQSHDAVFKPLKLKDVVATITKLFTSD